jgi:hypothetical protein
MIHPQYDAIEPRNNVGINLVSSFRVVVGALGRRGAGTAPKGLAIPLSSRLITRE